VVKRKNDIKDSMLMDTNGYDSSSYDNECYDSSPSINKGRERTRRTTKIHKIRRNFHWSSRLLGLSLLVWCGIQFATTEYMQQNTFWYIDIFVNETQGRSRQQQQQQQQYGDQYGNCHHHTYHGHQNRPPHPHRPLPMKNKNSRAAEKEKLEPGCELDPVWQSPESNSKLLSCQILHELDLTVALASSTTLSKSSGSGSRRRQSLSSSAHLGSGLWRDVWKIRDNSYMGDSGSGGDDRNNNNLNRKYVVLKMMKLEHAVIPRNLERHRREAATMSRLTLSPYVAELYSYCGNSILTEIAMQDLSRALKVNNNNNSVNRSNDSERRRKIKDANSARRIKEFKESILLRKTDNNHNSTTNIVSNIKEIHDSKRGYSTNNNTGIHQRSISSSSLSLTKRLDWALQASKAIADLHRSDIIHADITTKQFLVVLQNEDSNIPDKGSGRDNDKNNTSRIKINDFNRCRFVPRRQRNISNTDTANNSIMNSTWRESTDPCKIRIPSAPGKYRSPEEYSDKPLTPQMDVFSLGHVLYEIWTNGQNPWHDVGGKRIKNMVMDGFVPVELKKIEDWDARQREQQQQHKERNDGSFSEIDRAFGILIRECYQVNPERRITAERLVEEFTTLLAKERLTNKGTLQTLR